MGLGNAPLHVCAYRIFGIDRWRHKPALNTNIGPGCKQGALGVHDIGYPRCLALTQKGIPCHDGKDGNQHNHQHAGDHGQKHADGLKSLYQKRNPRQQRDQRKQK
ncbi:MAG TPA: hypothetical protein VJL82_07975 [Rhizomicrobium sp.]|nr:hypothetical protein [Rhizomicrobium sp.]